MNRDEIEKRKIQKLDELKQILTSFVNNGGKLDELAKKHPVYEAVKNYDIRVNGRRLTLEERFAYLGFQRAPQQKPFEEKLKDLKKLLDDFVANGGDVNSIDTHHPIYTKLRAFTPIINGKKPTLEELFTLLGHPRQPRYNDPQMFIDRLSELENYKDENGYVDSYRKDPAMKLFVSYCSETFDIPISFVVCLLANQKSKKHIVSTNRIEFLKTKLTEYLETHRDFCGIRRLDPQLYNLLNSISKSYPTQNGRKLSNLELVELLGFEGVDNSFLPKTETVQFSEKSFMNKYTPIIRSNNGTISLSDIHSRDYQSLSFYLRRLNETKSQFFSRFNVRYLDERIVECNKRVTLTEYPYLDEIQALFSEMLMEYLRQNPDAKNASEEKLFLVKLEALKAIYSEYKNKIEQKYILDSEETPSQVAQENFS